MIGVNLIYTKMAQIKSKQLLNEIKQTIECIFNTEEAAGLDVLKETFVIPLTICLGKGTRQSTQYCPKQ